MREWIMGLQKSATERGEGRSPLGWLAIEQGAGKPVPGELRDLYEAMDGAMLPPDVKLAPFAAVAELSRGLGGWWFGAKGAGQRLFAARRRELLEAGPAGLPDWVSKLEEDDWAYGLQVSATELR